MMKLSLLIAAATICAATAFAGNGIDVNGAHYNLNLLGKTDCADLPDNSNGKRIQVLLNGGQAAGDISGKSTSVLNKQNKIYLVEGDTFDVLDPTACDGAVFQLPGPGADGNVCYSIWARGLGKPDAYADMTLCATDPMDPTNPDDDIVVCSTDNTVTLSSSTHPSKFQNVTKELTTIDVTVNGKTYNVSIFDPSLEDYFWNYDNHGLRLAQLRFYGGACPE